MSIFGEVTAHEAYVGGAEVEIHIPISVRHPTRLELVGDDASDYSFADDAQITAQDRVVNLKFAPAAVGHSQAKLKIQGHADSVSLNGLGKNPVVFSDSSHDFGSVLVGDSEVKHFTVENHSGADVTLSLEKQVETDDVSAYTLDPSSVPATGVPVAVKLTFEPSATQYYSANVSAGSGALKLTLAATGKGSQDTVEDGVIQQTFSSDPGSEQPSTATRFSVFVPEHSSRFNMGKPSPTDAGANPIKINGIGLTTTQKILIYADGAKDTSKLGLQAEGDIYIQSNQADVLSLSSGNNVVAAGGSSYVLGDGGVLIATTVDGPTSKGDDDFPNADLSGDSNPLKAASGVGAFFSAADAFIALCGTIRAGRYLFLGGKSKSGKVFAGAAAVIGTLATSFSTVGATPKALPAVTIYGHSGVLIGTPGFGGVHCALGLALTSAYPIMAGLDCEVFGLHGVKVTGRETSLQSLVETTVKSHGKVTISADAKSPPPVPGAKLITGTLNGDISLEAAGEIDLFAGDKYRLTMDNIGVDIHADASAASKGRIAVTEQEVNLKLDKCYIKVTKSGITITDGKKGKVVMANGQITMTGAGKESVSMKSGKIELKSGSSSVQASSSGTTVKGSKVMLG
ncbi:MAG: hypothetical protein R3B07_07895 [Polyangiaceae bacterium]